MTLTQWMIVLFAGVFALVMFVSLTVFVFRIFREARPDKPKGAHGGHRYKTRKH